MARLDRMEGKPFRAIGSYLERAGRIREEARRACEAALLRNGDAARSCEAARRSSDNAVAAYLRAKEAARRMEGEPSRPGEPEEDRTK